METTYLNKVFDFEKSFCPRSLACIAAYLSGSYIFLSPFFPQQPCSEAVMSSRVAEGRLQVLQIYRLLQCIHEGDKVQIEKMLKLGDENLINLTEPQDGTGVLHVAVSANNQGQDSQILYTLCFIEQYSSSKLIFFF